MRSPLLAVVFFLLTPTWVTAQTQVIPRVSEEQARQFTRDRLVDGYTLLLGPNHPAGDVVAADNCYDLYAQRTALMRAQLDHRKPFWDEARHTTAVFVGAIWTPAFYYLPYRAVADTLGHEARRETGAALDTLRQAAAAQRCFER